LKENPDFRILSSKRKLSANKDFFEKGPNMKRLVNHKNNLVDTHAHICDPVFDLDRTEGLERAESAGIMTVIAVSEAMSDAKRNIALASENPALRPAAGLYPTHIRK
jgi:hypothetical protein